MGISEIIHLLGDLLGEVLHELEGEAVFAAEEAIRGAAKQRREGDAEGMRALMEQVAAMDIPTARAVARAFVLYFDLVNNAEDMYRVIVLRQREMNAYPAPISDSIEQAVSVLQERGVTTEQMRELISSLDIELVLTAHPTETRRRTVLSALKRIDDILRTMSFTQLLPREQEAAQDTLRTNIAGLWLTDRNRTVKPAVTDEVRTGMYFISQIFWTALPEVYDTLDKSLKQHYPDVQADHPWLRMASWIGGDRDGNPNVTADVTAETLRLHRGLAVEQYNHSLQDLSRQLAMNDREIPLPAPLRAWLESKYPFPPHSAYIQSRYPHETYRLALSLLSGMLTTASQVDMKAILLGSREASPLIKTEDLRKPLEWIASALPPVISNGPLRTLLRQVEIFGLHAARLDIREDASRLVASLSEVLTALGITPNYAAMDCEDRCDLLVRLLNDPPPNLAHHPGVTPETAETWALFELISRSRDIYGQQLLGPFIISMASCAADVLGVLLMARWTGCADCMEIVPLFETIQDLENAPRVLDELFSIETYQRHLETCQNRQTVMIGYSDSNKDGGYMMSNWALYQGQEVIARACRDHGVRLTLFHGRGGTVARGGGPVYRAIRSAPGGAIRGRYRMTEQGEIISSRYANLDLARRHLEQITSAVLVASLVGEVDGGKVEPFDQRVSPSQIPAAWREAMETMATAAMRAYRELVYLTPGFIDYWRAATPLEEIKHLQIGSRPALRKPGSEDVSRIRAIPWVFSWMQSRCNLPGWYGLGSGVEALTGQNSEAMELLREMQRKWPFFQNLIKNSEMSLLKADIEIAALYNRLVPDQALAEQVFPRIREEYERTAAAVLAILERDSLMEDEPEIQLAIQRRNPYVDPLSYIQVEMLRRLRALPDPESDAAKEIREVILLTINGIAAGLRSTG